MMAITSVQNIIFGIQSVKRARTGPEGLFTTLHVIGDAQFPDGRGGFARYIRSLD